MLNSQESYPFISDIFTTLKDFDIHYKHMKKIIKEYQKDFNITLFGDIWDEGLIFLSSGTKTEMMQIIRANRGHKFRLKSEI